MRKNPVRYIPPGYELLKEIPELGVQIYGEIQVLNGKNRAVAVAYGGKRNNPDWHYRFANGERLNAKINEYVANLQAREQAKAEYRAAKKVPVKVEVGDIFKAAWGYDQTNIDYYEVVNVVGKMIDVREIGQQREGNGLYMQGVCVPVPGAFVGGVMRKLVQGNNGQNAHFKIASYANAYKIDPVAVVAGVKIFEEDHWTAYA
jgi:hypothetical protein